MDKTLRISLIVASVLLVGTISYFAIIKPAVDKNEAKKQGLDYKHSKRFEILKQK